VADSRHRWRSGQHGRESQPPRHSGRVTGRA
jgi:hypothetical protein